MQSIYSMVKVEEDVHVQQQCTSLLNDGNGALNVSCKSFSIPYDSFTPAQTLLCTGTMCVDVQLHARQATCENPVALRALFAGGDFV